MSQPIPPLLCNTPPPIDFGDYSEDFTDLEINKSDEYEDNLISTSPQNKNCDADINSDLPPLPNTSEYSAQSHENLFVFKSSDEIVDGTELNCTARIDTTLSFSKEHLQEEHCFQDEFAMRSNESEHVEKEQQNELKPTIESTEKISREGSLLSLELSTTNLSGDDNDSEVDFPPTNNVKNDDSISLPSLKFDSIDMPTNITSIFDSKEILSKDVDDCVSKSENLVFCALSSVTKQENFDASCVEEKIIIPLTCTLEKEESNNCKSDSQDIEDKGCASDESISREPELKSELTSKLNCFHQSLVEHDSESQVEKQQEEDTNLGFAADFNKFDETVACNSSYLLNDSKAIVEKCESKESTFSEKITDSSDDFEEFQDFESQFKFDTHCDFAEFNTKTPQSIYSIKIDDDLREKIKSVLHIMFPNSNQDGCNSCYESSSFKILKNQIMCYLNRIDTTNALSYHWSNSNIKQSLIKSLGMDSRNILYGEKWNNPLPRFAANLVQNPLEPVKMADKLLSSLPIQERKIIKDTIDVQKQPPDDEFDWKSSAIINPLEGNQWNQYEERLGINTLKLENIEKPLAEPQTSNNEIKDTNIEITPHIRIGDDLNEKEQEPNLQADNDSCQNSFSSDKVESSSNISAFTLPLKETHIFTPKEADVNTQVTSTSKTCSDSIDFDYKMAAAGIIIDEKVVKKEYRDIEYNPSNWKFEENIFLKRLNEFQSGSNFECPFIEDLQVITAEAIKDDAKEPSIKSIVVNNKDWTGIDLSNNFSKLTTCTSEINSFGDIKSKNNIKNESINSTDNKSDDFSDFQYVSLPKVPSISNTNTEPVGENLKNVTETPMFLGDEMILSPSVFLPQAINVDNKPKIEWPEPGISSEELARIEELLPQLKNEVIKTDKSLCHINEDDDWSDFVSVTSPSSQALSAGVKNSWEKTEKVENSDEDWSDFVSGVPVAWNTTQTQQMQPQLNMWGESTARNTFNMYSFQRNQQPQPKSDVPNDLSRGRNNNNETKQSNVLLQRQTANISLIPDLGFIAPRSFINMPRPSISKK